MGGWVGCMSWGVGVSVGGRVGGWVGRRRTPSLSVVSSTAPYQVNAASLASVKE